MKVLEIHRPHKDFLQSSVNIAQANSFAYSCLHGAKAAQ